MTYDVLKPQVKHVVNKLSVYYFTRTCLRVDKQVLREIVDITNRFLNQAEPVLPKDLKPEQKEFIQKRPFLLCLVVWAYDNVDDKEFLKVVYMLFALVHFYFQFLRFFKICNDTRMSVASQSLRATSNLNRYTSYWDYLSAQVDAQLPYIQQQGQIVYRAFVRLSNNIRQTLRFLAKVYYKI